MDNPMDFNQLAQLAQILNVVLVAVSVFFIWREVRETARLTRASNTHKMTEISSAFYLLIAQDKETAAVWLQGSHDFSSLPEIDRYRYLSLMNWWLNLYENIYLQQRSKLLDESYFRAWTRELQGLVSAPSFQTVWQEVRASYSSDFIRFIEETLTSSGEEPSHTRTEKP
jgi:hypothetical protein